MDIPQTSSGTNFSRITGVELARKTETFSFSSKKKLFTKKGAAKSFLSLDEWMIAKILQTTSLNY